MISRQSIFHSIRAVYLRVQSIRITIHLLNIITVTVSLFLTLLIIFATTNQVTQSRTSQYHSKNPTYQAVLRIKHRKQAIKHKTTTISKKPDDLDNKCRSISLVPNFRSILVNAKQKRRRESPKSFWVVIILTLLKLILIRL